MLKMIARLSIVLGLVNISLAMALPIKQGIQDDIESTFFCQGSDPTTKPTKFTGTFTIKKHNQQYVLGVEEDHVGKKDIYHYNEFGIRQGHHLVIAFQNQTDTQVFGVEHLTIDNNGNSLAGTFAYWGLPDQMGNKSCKKIKKQK